MTTGLRKLALAAAVGVAAVAPSRADYTNHPYTYDVVNDQVIITRVATTFQGPKLAETLKLPSESGGVEYPVVAIGGGALAECYNLANLEIPPSVVSFGTNAFYNCLALTNLTIKGALTHIGAYAFAGCRSLPGLTIPASVTNLGPYAFSKCVTLSSMVIPGNISALEDGVFNGCLGLTAVALPTNLTRIGDATFKDCTGLGQLTIPGRVTGIGAAAFQGCTLLTQFALPENLATLGADAFAACTALTNITLGGSLTTLGDGALSGCTALPAITLPESVRTIGASAFSGCTALQQVPLPAALSLLGASAFSGCSGLTGCQLPTGLTHLASSTFRDCTGLAEVAIPPGVTGVGASAFQGCTSLPRIALPGGTVGASAFQGCTALTNVTLSEGVTCLELWAFRGCSSLTRLVTPATLTNLGEAVFYGCSGLTNVSLGGAFPALENLTFYGCTSLAGIVIPGSVTRLGGAGSLEFENTGVFSGCTALRQIVIPNSVTQIGQAAFYGCMALTNVEIGQAVATIGNLAFQGCAGLSSVTIPASVTAFGSFAFYNCANLTALCFEGNAPALGSALFTPVANCYCRPGTTGWDWTTLPGSFGGRPLYLWTEPHTLTVFSAYGEPNPGTWTTGVPVLPFTESLVGSPVLNGATQYVCAGGTVVGNDALWASPTNVTFWLTNDATLIWNWSTNYWLQLATNGSGSVLAPAGWQAAGATATLAAQTNEWIRFIAWSGETNGCTIAGATLQAPMNQARALSATFTTNRTLTVTSAHGTPVPGTTVTDYGARLQCGVAGAVELNGTTQYVCTGGTVSGNEYTADSATNVSLSLTNDTILTWQWQTNYYLSAMASGAGGAVSTSGWYAAGALATLVATPESNTHLATWLGDTNGCVAAGDTLRVPMTRARTLTALFIETTNRTLTVTSAHGGAWPGTTVVYDGTPFACWITNSPVLAGGTQYVATGCTVSGNGFTQGSPTNVSLTVTNDATLTWQWQTNYHLGVTAAGGGRVTGQTNGWLIQGAQALLTAVAATNTHLVGWLGDTNGCLVAGDTLLVPMDQARTISAAFVVTTNRTLTVLSAHGGVRLGTTVAYYGTMLQFSVTNSPLVLGATQYVCTGAAVAGNDYTLLSPTNVTLRLTNQAVLTWRWTTNYLLRIATNGTGRTSLPDGWQPKGSGVLVVAIPGSFARFGSWSGEIKGCKIKTNTLAVVMTAPRTITANFIGQGIVSAVTAPADGGTVTGGGTPLDTNKTVKLAAKPRTNWRFAGWADDANLPASRTVVVAQGGQTYTALFAMVTGEIVLSTNRLAFGTLAVKQVVTQQVVATNLGPFPVTVKSLKVPVGCSVAPKSFTLGITGSQVVTFVYQPAKAGVMSGAVVFAANAARGLGAGCLTLSGSAVAPPLRSPAARSAGDVVAGGDGVAGGDAALVVRVLELAPDAGVSDAEEEMAAVVVTGGRVEIMPLWQVGGGTLTLESRGADGDADGLPDAIAAALGDLWNQEGVHLLTIRRMDGSIMATTPFMELLDVEGGPVRPANLPAEWRLRQRNTCAGAFTSREGS